MNDAQQLYNQAVVAHKRAYDTTVYANQRAYRHSKRGNAMHHSPINFRLHPDSSENALLQSAFKKPWHQWSEEETAAFHRYQERQATVTTMIRARIIQAVDDQDAETCPTTQKKPGLWKRLKAFFFEDHYTDTIGK
jgi:hypothetical protein